MEAKHVVKILSASVDAGNGEYEGPGVEEQSTAALPTIVYPANVQFVVERSVAALSIAVDRIEVSLASSRFRISSRLSRVAIVSP
jgi:glutamate/tyrosine decarboxylase-like PLP-dependent enzyme